MIDQGSDQVDTACARVVARIVGLIQAGDLLPGDPLPVARELARDSGISSAAVVQAYRVLASGGWIETRVRRRPMVAHRLPDETGRDGSRLSEAAHLLGLDVDLSGCCFSGLTGTAAGSPSGEPGRRRGATLHQRRWLGQRLRATVRLAFSCGMTPGDLHALMDAAVTWESAFPFGEVDNPQEEKRGGQVASIPPFLMRKLRTKGVR